MCTRAVGNLVLKRIWKVFIQTKVELLTFEKAKEEERAENLQAENEVSDLYQQM